MKHPMLLFAEHCSDEKLHEPGSTATWHISPPKEETQGWRHIRYPVRQVEVLYHSHYVGQDTEMASLTNCMQRTYFVWVLCKGRGTSKGHAERGGGGVSNIPPPPGAGGVRFQAVLIHRSKSGQRNWGVTTVPTKQFKKKVYKKKKIVRVFP